MEPRTPSKRIICTPPKRGAHDEFWPEVEVTERVTVLHEETWGTTSATYEVTARWPVDIRKGHTREAIEDAEHLARIRVRSTIKAIEHAAYKRS